MKFKPDKKQALVMWRLMFTDETPLKSQLLPRLTPKGLGQLEEAGLIRMEKIGRGYHVYVTDKAWEWAEDHLDAKIEESRFASQALHGVLSKLQRYIKRRGTPLMDLVGPELELEESSPDDEPEAGITDKGPLEEMDDKVREAYLELTSNRFNVRVRLSDLRKRLGELNKKQQDYLLTEMQKRKKILLQPLPEESEITAKDREAALEYLGKSRHVLYMWGELPED
jgi:hypothetical protein